MNKYANIAKMVEKSNGMFEKMKLAGLTGVKGKDIGRDRLIMKNGHVFLNMSSCSYLGLNDHPLVKQGLLDGLEEAGSIQVPAAQLRVRLGIIDEVTEEFNDFFGCQSYLTLSCSMAAFGVLPLLAAGLFTNGIRPVMVFDKNAHFCMNYMKAMCADETEVITIGHNDLDRLEDICRTNRNVAYICESIYSTGGVAPLERLMELQEKYGVFLLIDEAHALSLAGKYGKGLVLDAARELNDKTIIISSLEKGFGAHGGGLVLFSERKWLDIMERFGGPFLWSAPIPSMSCGAARASLKLHKDGTVDELQSVLRKKVEYFDAMLGFQNEDPWSAVRVINIADEDKLLSIGKSLLDRGYYTATISFPTVKKEDAGLRVMIRANMLDEELKEFADIVKEYIA